MYIYGYDYFAQDIELMLGRKPNIYWKVERKQTSQIALTAQTAQTALTAQTAQMASDRKADRLVKHFPIHISDMLEIPHSNRSGFRYFLLGHLLCSP